MIKVLEAMGDLERLGVRELILDLRAHPVSPAEVATPGQLAPNSLDFGNGQSAIHERVQQQSTAVSPMLSAAQRGSPAFSVPKRH